MKRKAKNCKGCNLEDFNQTWKIFPSLTEDFQVNYALNPEVDGHLVVQPTWHAKSTSDLSEKQAGGLGTLIRNYCFALQEALNPEKIYVYSFNEDRYYHLHIHLKPRSRNVPKDITGAMFVDWADPEVKRDQRSIESIMQEIARRLNC